MADSAFVDILDAGDEFLVEAAGDLFVQALVRNYIVEQLSSLAVLHNQEKLAFGLDYLV